MIVLGITGGIGSGKSTVMNMLKEDYGAEVLLTDDIGHLSMEKGTKTYRQMVEAFGDGILDTDGIIDRQALGSMLLKSSEKMAVQNSIVHPFVIDYIKKKIGEYRAAGKKIVAVESAILFEAGCDDMCDIIWLVTVPEEVRIERLMRDRGYSLEKAKSFIARQNKDDYYLDKCDSVIYNGGNLESLSESIRNEFAKGIYE